MFILVLLLPSACSRAAASSTVKPGPLPRGGGGDGKTCCAPGLRGAELSNGEGCRPVPQGRDGARWSGDGYSQGTTRSLDQLFILAGMRCRFLPASLHAVGRSQVTMVVAAGTTAKGHSWSLSYRPDEATVKLETVRCSKVVH